SPRRVAEEHAAGEREALPLVGAVEPGRERRAAVGDVADLAQVLVGEVAARDDGVAVLAHAHDRPGVLERDLGAAAAADGCLPSSLPRRTPRTCTRAAARRRAGRS